MSDDWDKRTLLKLSREYTKDEVVQGLREIISQVRIENGMLKSELAELQDEVAKLKAVRPMDVKEHPKYRNIVAELQKVQQVQSESKKTIIELKKELVLEKEKTWKYG